jgi:serine/threonine protein kinase
MGAAAAGKTGKTGLDGAVQRAVQRQGSMAISGRYHRLPKTLEEDYEPLKAQVLGKGYNGVVYLAKSRTTGEKYAVKPFKLSGINREKRSELESECEIFLGMDHPHVARLTDVYEEPGVLNVVMECMSGGEVFKRVLKEKRFSEKDACDTAWQMLLALNYIHHADVVHRDIKLENFLYDKEGSKHLKLIDFGFSKVWEPNTKMKLSCGTLSYVAPEVLGKSYDSKCDLWSLGVTVFILLFGYMPFSGAEAIQIKMIKQGKYSRKEREWRRVSSEAQRFVESLLVVDPGARLSAAQALETPWIKKRDDLFKRGHEIDRETVDALSSFAQASHFRRAAMNMMAWSLTNDERATVRDAFLEMDTDRSGTISLSEFKKVMLDKFHVDDEQASAAFEAIDYNQQDEIHYSEFLAAMASCRIQMHDDLIKNTFKRFDVDSSGHITKDNLKSVLGDTFKESEVEGILADIDMAHDGQISYDEFFEYMTHPEADSKHHELAAAVIDRQVSRDDARAATVRSRTKPNDQREFGIKRHNMYETCCAVQ